MQETAGDQAVDGAVAEALRELTTIDELPVHEHPDVIDRVHRALQERLSEADETSG